MIFSTKNIKTQNQLFIDNTSIDRVHVYNYLGVHLDEHLTFEAHAKNTIKKVSDKVYQLKKLRHFLTQNAALLVYKNMILPILEYGDIYLASATKGHRKKLQILQNKALKCALSKDRTDGTPEVHAEAKISKLATRRKIHLLLHFFQLTRNPNFKGWKAKLKINTRSNKKKLMLVKKPNLVKFQNSITYRGPPDIQNHRHIHSL